LTVGRLGGITTAWRALRSRVPTSLLIFVVAAIAVAGGTAGPTYYQAGQTSILRDTLASAPVSGRGFEITETGPVSMSFNPLAGEESVDLGSSASLFDAPVQARQATVFYDPMSESLLLASSTGVCGHVRVQGRCPRQEGQILVNEELAGANGWRAGQSVDLAPWGKLTITGTYTTPSASDPYWFDQLITYFPQEYASGLNSPGRHSSPYDAVFATEATLLRAPNAVQGTLVVDDSLKVDRVLPADNSELTEHMSALLQDVSFQTEGVIVSSTIPATMSQVRSAWSTLAVPVVVVTLELLALAVLLLWILITDATAARGPEIALAKLRGYGRGRLTAFALTELIMLILAAIPLGVLAGWGAAQAIGSGLLRSGTPIRLPALGWAAGAVAAGGGIAAAVVAARPTVRRPVVEEWRRSNQRPARPGWTFDAIVLTGAAAGLAEVAVSGSISSTHQHPITLIVPGLIGLAVAVVAARLLPIACALAAGRFRRGGAALFLALRQLSRRPGAMRTTTVLAAAFALAAFALSAWSVARSNSAAVAAAQVGAPTVLDVTTPYGSDLNTLVQKADPTGRYATAVVLNGGSSTSTMGVTPAEWSHIHLRSPSTPTVKQLDRLEPTAPPPLILNGDDMRLDVTTRGLNPAGTSLIVNFSSPGGTAPTPVQLPVLPTRGMVQMTSALPPCPCLLDDITLEPPPAQFAESHLHGSATITRIETESAGRWTTLPASYLDASRWYDPAHGDTVAPAPTGLDWNFQTNAGTASLSYQDRPIPLPAIASRSVTSHTGLFNATGFNGANLPVDVIAIVGTTPGAPGTGIIVDLNYAQLAAEGNLMNAQKQVWVAGREGEIERRLRAEGVTLNQVVTQAGDEASLRRSGPGLADTLFLAEAAAAAVLASGTAIAALYLLARRRRYELAALLTVGLDRKRLIISVLIEQVLLTTYGALVGVAAGLGAAVLLLRDVPEFASRPTGVPLASFPSVSSIAPVLAAGLILVLVASAAAAVRLVSGAQLTQLREAPA
jgi:putative ABC transport system permease protein